jgi:transcriptional regulator with XRE-family HTH domain
MAAPEDRRRMVGERLAELREQKALTLHDLEELSGVGADGISKIENGHRKPRPATLRKLARALGVEVEDFFREPAVPLVEAPPPSGPSHIDAVYEEAVEEFNQRHYGPSIIAQGWDRLTKRWTQRLENGDFNQETLQNLVETLEDVATGMEANVANERKELVARYGAEAAPDMSLLRPSINRLGLLVGEILKETEKAEIPVKPRSNVVHLAGRAEKEAS